MIINDTESEATTQQRFEFGKKNTVERVITHECNEYRITVPSAQRHKDAEKDFFHSYLGPERPKVSSTDNLRLTYMDFFCGGGGLSLGVSSGLRALGHNPKMLAAIDTDKTALNLISSHFKPLFSRAGFVEKEVEYAVDHSGNLNYFITSPQIIDPRLGQFKGKVDLLIGGPPCQGHSNLNNKTRRFDPRNLLYYTMPAFAFALNIPLVIIENVPSIESASEDVVGITRKIFENNGYSAESVVLNAAHYGVAQNRQRHILIAAKADTSSIQGVLQSLKTKALSFDDVNYQLPALGISNPLLESPSDISKENIDRINYLHTNNLYNLPNKERPVCHQDGHTYPSVYGRIRPDQPTGTITTGFRSPGRGRYIHPHEPRVINIREAARLQSFPDWFWEHAPEIGLTKSNFQKIIGDAVPPLLAEAITISLHDVLKSISKDRHG